MGGAPAAERFPFILSFSGCLLCSARNYNSSTRGSSSLILPVSSHTSVINVAFGGNLATIIFQSVRATPTSVDASQARGWAHEVYYMSVDRNALTPSFRLMVVLLCNLFLQGYSS